MYVDIVFRVNFGHKMKYEIQLKDIFIIKDNIKTCYIKDNLRRVIITHFSPNYVITSSSKPKTRQFRPLPEPAL